MLSRLLRPPRVAFRRSLGSWDRVPEKVRIVEVSPRDGLQNERTLVSTSDKLELIARLGAAGLRSIEATSFVNPKAVPQMADAEQVMKGVDRSLGTTYSALVPNLKGLEKAAACGTEEVAVLLAATETMSRRNTNCSLAESLDRASAVLKAALAHGMRTRAAVAVSMVCPYEGDVPERTLAEIVARFYEEGCHEIMVCDTVGKATPGKTLKALEAIKAAGVPMEAIALHLHDTYGQAVGNMLVGLQQGVSVMDAAVAGLGGCPFAGPGASGNLATEDLVYMLQGVGVETGVDLKQLAETGGWICGKLGRASSSKAGAAVVKKKAVTWGKASRKGPLAGVKVLELGNFIAGPFCATSLAYFGADVVKVEAVGKGDPIRYWRSLAEDGQSPWSRSLLRNKRSITVDMKKPEGLKIVRALAEQADVLVENFRPGVLEKFKLAPSDLKEANPGLIVARISGYGQTGPYKTKPGFASAAEGEGGFRFVNGFPGEAPVRPNLSMGDSLAGLQAAFGVVMALWHRAQTGQGQVVDMALYEAVYNMMEGLVPDYTCLGVVRQPSGTTVTGIVPTNTHKCKDGKCVVVGANGDAIFKRVMTMMGHEDVAKDERYADNAGRVAHQDFIYKLIDEWCAEHTLEEALSKLEGAGCPSGPVYDVADMLKDPHFVARGMFEEIKTPTNLSFKIPAMVPKLSETPGETAWCGPEVGAHNAEVLRDFLNYKPEEIERLREEKAIGSECT